MDYHDYLKTPYWDLVRKFKYAEAENRCQSGLFFGGDCVTSCGILNCHHMSYDHVGYEHLNLGDLIVLCQTCHNTIHWEGKAS